MLAGPIDKAQLFTCIKNRVKMNIYCHLVVFMLVWLGETRLSKVIPKSRASY